jgi:hypothetical protein
MPAKSNQPVSIGPADTHRSCKNVNKSKGPDKYPGLSQIGEFEDAPDGKSRLFVLFGLLFRRRQTLKALQKFLLRHAFDRDLGVVGIDARAGGAD